MSHLPQVLQEALDTARGIQDEADRVYVLSRLAPHLPQLLPEALTIAYGIQADFARVYALSRLVPHLPQLLPEVLDAVFETQDYFVLRSVLIRLAPHLPPELLPVALDVAYGNGIQSDENSADAISELAPHLPPELLPVALDVARGIQDDRYRAKALSGLAIRLPQVLQEALNTARGIQDEKYRADVFSSLLSVLDLTSIKYPLWHEILHNLSHHNRYQLLKDIPKLSDAIIALGGTKALAATVRAIQEVWRQWR